MFAKPSRSMLGFQFPDNPHCPSHVRGEVSSSCDRGRLEHLSRAPLFNRTSHRFTAQPPSSLVKAMTRTVIRQTLRNNSIPTPLPSPLPPFLHFECSELNEKITHWRGHTMSCEFLNGMHISPDAILRVQQHA
jgi:hypothetical protein